MQMKQNMKQMPEEQAGTGNSRMTRKQLRYALRAVHASHAASVPVLLAVLLLTLSAVSAQQQTEPKQASDGSFQVHDRQELIRFFDSVIDDMADASTDAVRELAQRCQALESRTAALASENDTLKKEAVRLSQKRRFWLKVSLLQSAVILTGVYTVRHLRE